MAQNKTCPSCGAVNEPGNKKCKYCGYLLPMPEIEKVSAEEEQLFEEVESESTDGMVIKNRSPKWRKNKAKMYGAVMDSFAGKTVLGIRRKSHTLKRIICLLDRLQDAIDNSLNDNIEFSKNLLAGTDRLGLMFESKGQTIIGIGMKTDNGCPYINMLGEYRYYYTNAKLKREAEDVEQEIRRMADYAKLSCVLKRSFTAVESAIWAWVNRENRTSKSLKNKAYVEQ